MVQVISNYISQIEHKKNDLLKEVDNFSLDNLLLESNTHKVAPLTNASSSVSAPYRPWLIFGGSAALVGTVGVIGGTENSDRNWTIPLFITGFLSVAYGLVKMKRQHSVSNVKKKDLVHPNFKNMIYEKISELTDNIINEWSTFIVALNKTVQESIKSNQGEEVDEALNETYYCEKIKIDKFTLYLALKKEDGAQTIIYKKLVECYLSDLKKMIILAINNQIDRYKKVEMLLSNR